MTVLDTSTNMWMNQAVNYPGEFLSVAVTPDKFRLCHQLARFRPWSCRRIIGVSTNTFAMAVPVEYAPTGVAITPKGAYAYVVNRGISSVPLEVSVSSTQRRTPVGLSRSGRPPV